jgi:hypothetical protein
MNGAKTLQEEIEDRLAQIRELEDEIEDLEAEQEEEDDEEEEQMFAEFQNGLQNGLAVLMERTGKA